MRALVRCGARGELARAVTTRQGADIKCSRLALLAIPQDQRRAIAETVEQA